MTPEQQEPTESASTVRITIDYGYDIHSLRLDTELLERARQGEVLLTKGQGFSIEGEEEEDCWEFNKLGSGSLRVYCDNGHEVFRGHIDDACVE